VQLAARGATDTAIATRNADRSHQQGSGERFPHAWRAFHMDKSRPRDRDGFRDFEHLAEPFRLLGKFRRSDGTIGFVTHANAK
jgi:hypothetical protein